VNGLPPVNRLGSELTACVAEELEREQKMLKNVQENAGRDQHGVLRAAMTQAVEVENVFVPKMTKPAAA
jgi:hypothetical protein